MIWHGMRETELTNRREKDRQSDILDKRLDGHACTVRQRKTDTHTGRQTERQTEWETHKQTDVRVTNRQRLAERKRIHGEGRWRKKYVETRREEKATYQLRETEQLPQTQPGDTTTMERCRRPVTANCWRRNINWCFKILHVFTNVHETRSKLKKWATVVFVSGMKM